MSEEKTSLPSAIWYLRSFFAIGMLTVAPNIISEKYPIILIIIAIISCFVLLKTFYKRKYRVTDRSSPFPKRDVVED